MKSNADDEEAGKMHALFFSAVFPRRLAILVFSLRALSVLDLPCVLLQVIFQ